MHIWIELQTHALHSGSVVDLCDVMYVLPKLTVFIIYYKTYLHLFIYVLLI